MAGHSSRRPMRALFLATAFAIAASGCGQRGDLYLRDNPPAGVKPEKPPAYTPVPYPKDADDKGAGDAKKP